MLLPGTHALELVLGESREVTELTLAAGTTMPWPRRVAVSPAPPAAPENDAPHVSPRPLALSLDLPTTRPAARTAAWVVGGTSMAAFAGAVFSYGWAFRSAERLGRRDPEAPGYLHAYDAYERRRASVVPLALGAGTLAAIALGLASERVARVPRQARYWTLGAAALALGAGVAVAVLTPRPARGSEGAVDMPTRFGASFAFAVAIPLGTWGFLQRPARAEGSAP